MKERKREVGKEREILQYQYVQTVMPDQVVFHLLCSSSLDLRVSNNKGSIHKILLNNLSIIINSLFKPILKYDKSTTNTISILSSLPHFISFLPPLTLPFSLYITSCSFPLSLLFLPSLLSLPPLSPLPSPSHSSHLQEELHHSTVSILRCQV